MLHLGKHRLSFNKLLFFFKVNDVSLLPDIYNSSSLVIAFKNPWLPFTVQDIYIDNKRCALILLSSAIKF